jgi:ribonuclease R
MPPRSRGRVPRPTKQDILNFINQSSAPVGKREIAREFRIRGDDRTWLKSILKELEVDGSLNRGRGRRVTKSGRLPEIAELEISHVDGDGEVVCRPAEWSGDAPPLIYLVPDTHRQPAPGEGDRILARLKHTGDNVYEARAIKVLGSVPNRILGVFERIGDGGIIRPTDRRIRTDFTVTAANIGEAQSGDLVHAETVPGRGRERTVQPRAKIKERLGALNDPRTFSLIAIHTNGIPDEFDEEILAAANEARPVTLDDRTDLRHLPLITIDGVHARDFDDAVWAEPDDNEANNGGWHIIVAIADVSWYVRTGSALDRTARERGNSVYFPDRVVPMLPEALSNGLCSLKPHEDRACLAVHMWIGANGVLRRKKFVRGLMCSAARLTYDQVEHAKLGSFDDDTKPLAESVIAPLYGAYKSLARARVARGTLDFDVPEREVTIGTDGHIERIQPSVRLDSHRLIEEFMISANVAAAETLEASNRRVMYRVHDAPPLDKIEALRQSLDSLGFSLAKGSVLKPINFLTILKKAADGKDLQLVSELILRSQSKAMYDPANLGHFGLSLQRYCHFTSPIRRYADLLVHRGLISALKLGSDGLGKEEEEQFEDIGQQLCLTERRAVTAERNALDRFAVAFVSERVGATFAGRISGATRFGLFVTLDETGTDGLVPMRALPNDYYHHDDVQHCLVGERTGRTFRFGDRLSVRLEEANLVTGGLVFSVIEGGVIDKNRKRRNQPKGSRRPAAKKSARRHKDTSHR